MTAFRPPPPTSPVSHPPRAMSHSSNHSALLLCDRHMTLARHWQLVGGLGWLKMGIRAPG
jgi:hypothetical protein